MRIHGTKMSHTFAGRGCGPPAGFTLVEAVVAISITVIGGAALLLGINSSLQTTKEAMEQTIAMGIAQQLLDEVVGARYCPASTGDPYETTLGPTSYERSGPGRSLYEEIGAYNGIRSRPPTDLWGVALGTDDGEGGQRHPNFFCPPHFFDKWQQEVDIYYVDETDLTTRLPQGKVSDYRAVEVRIVLVDPDRGQRELAKVRQVIAYVPST
jgi:type II secretory pathway pseudopilin PulG